MDPRAPKVELLWWRGCPSTEAAHRALSDVMQRAGLDPGGIELREIETDEQAEAEDFAGSPTIVIDGRQVQPAADEPRGLTCRIYRLRDGRPSPVPDSADLRDALRQALAERS